MGKLVQAGCVAALLVGAVAVGSQVGAASAASPAPTVTQMYANVDQVGDLGSHVGATKVVYQNALGKATGYLVTFKNDISKCAAEVQPGFAGGNLIAAPYTSVATYVGTKTFFVQFQDLQGDRVGLKTAFMITVTCGAK